MGLVLRIGRFGMMSQERLSADELNMLMHALAATDTPANVVTDLHSVVFTEVASNVVPFTTTETILTAIPQFVGPEGFIPIIPIELRKGLEALGTKPIPTPEPPSPEGKKKDSKAPPITIGPIPSRVRTVVKPRVVGEDIEPPEESSTKTPTETPTTTEEPEIEGRAETFEEPVLNIDTDLAEEIEKFEQNLASTTPAPTPRPVPIPATPTKTKSKEPILTESPPPVATEPIDKLSSTINIEIKDNPDAHADNTAYYETLMKDRHIVRLGEQDPSYRNMMFTQEAYDDMIKHGMSDRNVEVGGALVGFHHGDQTVITGFIPAEHAVGTVGNIKFTTETWATFGTKIDARNSQNGTHDIMIGWFHSHPNDYPPQPLTGGDRFIMKGYFPESDKDGAIDQATVIMTTYTGNPNPSIAAWKWDKTTEQAVLVKGFGIATYNANTSAKADYFNPGTPEGRRIGKNAGETIIVNDEDMPGEWDSLLHSIKIGEEIQQEKEPVHISSIYELIDAHQGSVTIEPEDTLQFVPSLITDLAPSLDLDAKNMTITPTHKGDSWHVEATTTDKGQLITLDLKPDETEGFGINLKLKGFGAKGLLAGLVTPSLIRTALNKKLSSSTISKLTLLPNGSIIFTGNKK
jgi:proteasome lid subunit RPN8/RPN11